MGKLLRSIGLCAALLLFSFFFGCDQMEKEAESQNAYSPPPKENGTPSKINPQLVKENIEPHFTLPATEIQLNNGLRLKLSMSDAAPFALHYIPPKAADSIQQRHSNSQNMAFAVEEYQKAAFGAYFRQDTDTLFLKLANGDWKPVLMDPGTDQAGANFEHYFAEQNYILVRVQWGEGNDYRLVHRQTGKETNVFGQVAFSPDGRWMVSVNADIDAHYSNNGLQLYEVQGNALTLRGQIPSTRDEIMEWGPYAVRWMDEDVFLLSCSRFSAGGKYAYFTQRAEIIAQ